MEEFDVEFPENSATEDKDFLFEASLKISKHRFAAVVCSFFSRYALAKTFASSTKEEVML